MSTVKDLLQSLLEEIYEKTPPSTPCGKIATEHEGELNVRSHHASEDSLDEESQLTLLSINRLIEMRSILGVEIRLTVRLLERSLLARDRHRRHQEILCRFVDAFLYVRFSKWDTNMLAHTTSRHSRRTALEEGRRRQNIPTNNNSVGIGRNGLHCSRVVGRD